MKKYKILALAIFACVTLNGWAQSEDNVTGRVLDEKGKPVAEPWFRLKRTHWCGWLQIKMDVLKSLL